MIDILTRKMSAATRQIAKRAGRAAAMRLGFERLETRTVLSASYATAADFVADDMHMVAGQPAHFGGGENWRPSDVVSGGDIRNDFGPATFAATGNYSTHGYGPSTPQGPVFDRFWYGYHDSYRAESFPQFWRAGGQIFVIVEVGGPPARGAQAQSPAGVNTVFDPPTPPKLPLTGPPPTPASYAPPAANGAIQPNLAAGLMTAIELPSTAANSQSRQWMSTLSKAAYENAFDEFATANLAANFAATHSNAVGAKLDAVLSDTFFTEPTEVDGMIGSLSGTTLEPRLASLDSAASERAAVDFILQHLHDTTETGAVRKHSTANVNGNAGQPTDRSAGYQSAGQKPAAGVAADNGMILLPATGDANESDIHLAAVLRNFGGWSERLAFEALLDDSPPIDVTSGEAFFIPAESVRPPALPPQMSLPSQKPTHASARTEGGSNFQPAAAAVSAIGILGVLVRRRKDGRSRGGASAGNQPLARASKE